MRRKEGKYGAAVVSDAAAAPRLAVRGEVRRFNGSWFYHAELLFPRRRGLRETGRAVALGSVFAQHGSTDRRRLAKFKSGFCSLQFLKREVFLPHLKTEHQIYFLEIDIFKNSNFKMVITAAEPACSALIKATPLTSALPAAGSGCDYLLKQAVKIPPQEGQEAPQHVSHRCLVKLPSGRVAGPLGVTVGQPERTENACSQADRD